MWLCSAQLVHTNIISIVLNFLHASILFSSFAWPLSIRVKKMLIWKHNIAISPITQKSVLAHVCSITLWLNMWAAYLVKSAASFPSPRTIWYALKLLGLPWNPCNRSLGHSLGPWGSHQTLGLAFGTWDPRRQKVDIHVIHFYFNLNLLSAIIKSD